MDSIEINKAMYYCKKKCGTIDCTDCEYVFSSDNCEAYFIYDLYDIVDTKTLEFNNKKDIIDSMYNIYIHTVSTGVEYSFQYTIQELFLDNRYKITKKLDYDKLIESCGKES